MIGYTESQRQRLTELGRSDDLDREFYDAESRERSFATTESMLKAENISALKELSVSPHRNRLAVTECTLADALVENGFMELKTPTVIPVSALDKMTITENHPLRHQIFYTDEGHCLRPMLATNLYVSMVYLRRCLSGPVRFFEIGSCFRKESHSSAHLDEFTMLNLVEMSPSGDPLEVLKSHIATVMDAMDMDYKLEDEESDVYKMTTDVTVGGMEVASGAVGPHSLDAAHGVNEPWCGVGFGLERLIMAKYNEKSIRRAGRGLAYVNGIRIDI
jgi:pyrrolysyl-tRNA synthetase-like protein